MTNLSGRVGKIQLAKRGLVYGVGVNDHPTSTKVNGVELKEYRVWKDMLKRCYSEKYKTKYPSYSDVHCCSDWLVFSKFVQDLKNLPCAFEKGYHLDKDILGDGCLYSPETCCFIPEKLNLSLTERVLKPSELGRGVRLENGSYCARMSGLSLGRFSDIESARKCYVDARKKRTVEIVKEYFDVLDVRVLNKLILGKM